jgi:acyl-CoA synthetase (AMP-forming)/AMP-acid ligase II
MGLLGNMYIGLYHPGTVTYITPDQFIAKPAVWLQALSRYRGVVSAAPDFAYGLCTAKVKDQDMEGVDLSSWKIAFNGAEPISVAGMKAFSERFARWGFRPEAMTPVYGLAEAGLAVSFSDPRTLPRVSEFDSHVLSARGEAVAGSGRRLVSVGCAVPGLDIEIQDDQGDVRGAGRVGRVMVKGPSITPGYFNDPDLSRRTIRDGWLDTGDLGFFHGGQLYLSGRLKDLIIIRGRNLAPQEVEEQLRGLEGLRVGCTVAVSCAGEAGGAEELVILAERDLTRPRPDADLKAEISDRILRGLGLVPAHVELLAPGTLPRTSSGKLRRSEATRLYVAGELKPPENMGTLQIARELGRSRLALMRFWLRRAVRPAVAREADPR